MDQSSSNFLPRRPVRPSQPTVRGSYDPRIITVKTSDPSQPTRVFTPASKNPQSTSSIKTETS